ncbi:trypsin-like peptidase domain-containing protein [Streptomyces sp. NPDC102490]|uniref:S1C family serine protease n=1 Tax=Streptomyces sp. NPDC102490 TaxID=3366183 RepID=UPI00382C8842
MNEGKPTKAKWWSRPRSSEDAPDGDFELERPRPNPTAGTGTATDGGDFELERPAPPRPTDEGDYELDLPRPEHPEPTDAGGLLRDGRSGADVPEPADAGLPRQGDRRAVPAQDAVPAEDVSSRAHAATGSAPSADTAPAAERPKPLHEPDPYSTPPYGEPGPWAPAPPVQHPATTPAHGTATTAPHAPGTPAPAATPASGSPAPAATPASGSPAPAATHAPGTATAAPHAPGSPAPAAPHAPGTPAPAAPPAHGTATAAPHASGTPAPETPPAPHTPAPATPHSPVLPASASSGSPPPGAVPDPAFADAPPPVPRAGQDQHPAAAAPAHDAPPPAATPAHDATPPAAVPAYDTTPPGAAPAPDPWAGPATPGAAAEPTADPWGRYDPWAASAQLHDVAERAPKRRRRPGAKVLVGGALLIALVSGGIGGVVGAHLERNGGVGTVELPQAGPEAAGRDPDSVAGIAARALPSVVTLHVSGSEAAGTGTGFVLDDRGHILTNNHVVEPAGSGGEITVTFNSGDTAEATVVGRDSGYDLAVVKVKGVSGLTPMPLGNSDNVRVGDPVVAIGAPFDLAGTVTSGIISAKERPITAGGEEGEGSDVSYVDALQTDAPINPGNSGGPLLDARGRAIGINSAIRSADSGSAESDGGQAGSIGLGFAIPVNQGKRVAEELINTGKATHPVIGITLDMNYTGDGARVSAKDGDGGPAVTTGGPGAKAGIKPGDVITAVDGQRVHSGEELIVKTRAHRPGDRLELTLERDGKETEVSLVLGSSGGD